MQNVTATLPTDSNFPLCLAPMVGLTHVALRKVAQSYMPKNASTHWPTEMLSSRKLPNEVLGKNAETIVDENEPSLVPQILGNDETHIRESIIRLQKEWNIVGVDINMGCPVQKALKHNYGVALMGDVDYAAQVVSYAAKASSIPVSVKLRAVGSGKSVPELIQFVEKLVDAGAAWITLHPRTAEQQRRGTADWSQITELKKAINVPVIGNGDIQTADDVLQMMNETKADKVMAGRALAARPWMLWQLGEKLGFEAPVGRENFKAPQTEIEEGAEYGRMLLNFIRTTDHYFRSRGNLSESLVLRKIQFFVRTTHVWLEFGHYLMSEVNKAKTVAETLDNVEKFFQSEQRMFARTELRQ